MSYFINFQDSLFGLEFQQQSGIEIILKIIQDISDNDIIASCLEALQFLIILDSNYQWLNEQFFETIIFIVKNYYDKSSQSTLVYKSLYILEQLLSIPKVLETLQNKVTHVDNACKMQAKSVAEW